MGIGHLDVVAEDVIEGDLQRRDPGLPALPLPHLEEILLPPAGDGAQLVQTAAHPGSDHPPLAHLSRCVRIDRLLDLGRQLLRRIEPERELPERLCPRLGEEAHHRSDQSQPRRRLQQLARRDTPHRHLARQSLQIAYPG